ncbi:four helix bundle protein [Winogradskyella sp. 3972H.M.0a.05]|uniref:four helix bundle protein n=1 Tax=Winogradskyella sp. 3972H.M.0a.05 TaxID=2950277 RepID=UPI0033929106
MKVFSFEKLEVWQESTKLVKQIYNITNSFPQEEKFGLTSQMRRSSISIASNLAEGTSRKTARDKAHFSTIAFSSAMELLNQLIISKELNFVTEESYILLRKKLEKITNMLNALRNYQLKDK